MASDNTFQYRREDGPTQPVPTPDDPWMHRSLEMRCRTCMWFVEKMPEGPGRYVLGRCRRHAPTMSGYPVVYDTDWCGDHKLSENA